MTLIVTYKLVKLLTYVLSFLLRTGEFLIHE